MSIIFNLVLFLIIILILLIICNNLPSDENNKKSIKVKKDPNNSDFEYGNNFDNIFKNSPKSVPSVIFDYEKDNYQTVAKNNKPFILEDKFKKDQKIGAQFVPKYEPPVGEEHKEFYNKDHIDQPIIYDNRMYEKPIHIDREIVQNIDTKLPAKISDVYDSSIIDFKNLVPKMKGKNSTIVSDGGFKSNAFNPDFMIYENEKPENGGIIPKLYDTVYGYDPLLEIECAKF